MLGDGTLPFVFKNLRVYYLQWLVQQHSFMMIFVSKENCDTEKLTTLLQSAPWLSKVKKLEKRLYRKIEMKS